jgi:di-heme oxidoreductase (putative peroxidase)
MGIPITPLPHHSIIPVMNHFRLPQLTPRRLLWIAGVVLVPVLGLALQSEPVRLEYRTERPGGSRDDPVVAPRDLSGRSIKTPRVRVVHSMDAGQEGTSAYFLFADPWLGYGRGRELFLREFAAWDGVFGESGQHGGPLLDDGVSRQQLLGHVSSCGLCHNIPYRDAGHGATIAKNGGTGRNTPHLYGAGLLEMLGWQLRLELLALGDRDRNGWISTEESLGRRAVVYNVPTGSPEQRYPVDFGRFGDRDGDGRPDLDPALHLIYVDRDGKRIPWARNLRVSGVAGYTFEFQVFGFGHRARVPIASTLRAFTSQPWDIHSGLQAHDPTTLVEPNGDGLARVSLAGAPQFVSGASRDRGLRQGPGGISLDDPDRDGHLEEISEGDLDLIEWYLLNHPAPAQHLRTPEVARGERLFARAGCTACHVPDWRLHAANSSAPDYTRRYRGDRRFFHLDVGPGVDGRLRGRVRLLAEKGDGRWRRKLGPFTIRGVYSDFRYHDLGPECRQLQFDGSTLTRFRTTPLWGVGTTAPYGHDGSALTLEEVIRRHGGEAADSRSAYARLTSGERTALLAFLQSLVLYGTDDLPTDVDEDGRIEPHFRVAGKDTGLERFSPEWLFNVPGEIEGPAIGPDGRSIVSHALANMRGAYGVDLPYCRDANRDGFPDILGFSLKEGNGEMRKWGNE